MDVSVAVTPQALTGNLPDNTLIQVTFTYSGSVTHSGTTIYYGATISDTSDPVKSENVLFPLTVTAGPIPTTGQIFEYEPTEAFTGTLTAGTTGKVYYTP